MVAAAEALVLTDEQRGGLERLARSHRAPVREVRQAKALLWAAEGVSNAEIARRCGSTTKSVRRWRSRFCADGLASVGRIRPGRGRPAEIDASVVAAIVHDTLHTVPDDGSVAWSTRTLGRATGWARTRSLVSGGRVGCARGRSTRSSCPATRTSRPSLSMWSACT